MNFFVIVQAKRKQEIVDYNFVSDRLKLLTKPADLEAEMKW